MTLLLIDTSVTARSWHPGVEGIVRQAIESGVAATCITVDLEAGYSARSGSELRRVSAERDSLFARLECTPETERRARDVQLLLAERGLHRSAGIIDLITAAIAEHHGATILHYDADFEHIAEVTGQAHRWVMPRGSL